MKKFIFDIDGTLTPSREKMDTQFHAWFLNFQKVYDTYLVTGSDRSKTIEQVGEQVGIFEIPLEIVAPALNAGYHFP